ncbi:uncharacterized protein KD926_001267 [Aspergillus affinis]|uniref:uncharacterized protein n=1 Tax=Aspergillus affinis TaxID=1070780 RepID=UPI0022FEA1D8|nr:uncharacterized protein KD926_001267 [Aspergillus affinis]KAI9036811.1 hypothetical protein KD926_001267 [Aspergillus affinis]
MLIENNPITYPRSFGFKSPCPICANGFRPQWEFDRQFALDKTGMRSPILVPPQPDANIRVAVPKDPALGVIGRPGYGVNDSRLLYPLLTNPLLMNPHRYGYDAQGVRGSLAGYAVNPLCWNMVSSLFREDGIQNLSLLSGILMDRYNYVAGHGAPTRNNPIEMARVQFYIKSARKYREAAAQTRFALKSIHAQEHFRLSTLPQELRVHTMEYLRFEDVFALKKAVGWTAPSIYWKERVDTMMFFEVKSVLGHEDIDWHLLVWRL